MVEKVGLWCHDFRVVMVSTITKCMSSQFLLSYSDFDLNRVSLLYNAKLLFLILVL